MVRDADRRTSGAALASSERRKVTKDDRSLDGGVGVWFGESFLNTPLTNVQNCDSLMFRFMSAPTQKRYPVSMSRSKAMSEQ